MTMDKSPFDLELPNSEPKSSKFSDVKKTQKEQTYAWRTMDTTTETPDFD